MAYLREGMSRASMLFDCTYLNFVGGLYRRSLHDRCGVLRRFVSRRWRHRVQVPPSPAPSGPPRARDARSLSRLSGRADDEFRSDRTRGLQGLVPLPHTRWNQVSLRRRTARGGSSERSGARWSNRRAYTRGPESDGGARPRNSRAHPADVARRRGPEARTCRAKPGGGPRGDRHLRRLERSRAPHARSAMEGQRGDFPLARATSPGDFDAHRPGQRRQVLRPFVALGVTPGSPRRLETGAPFLHGHRREARRIRSTAAPAQ